MESQYEAGSGGFTSYSWDPLQKQLGGWVSEGISRIKMKVGTHPPDDLDRVRVAREAIGPNVDCLFAAVRLGDFSCQLLSADHKRIKWIGERALPKSSKPIAM